MMSLMVITLIAARHATRLTGWLHDNSRRMRVQPVGVFPPGAQHAGVRIPDVVHHAVGQAGLGAGREEEHVPDGQQRAQRERDGQRARHRPPTSSPPAPQRALRPQQRALHREERKPQARDAAHQVPAQQTNPVRLDQILRST